MDIEFTCTIHNLRFGMDRNKDFDQSQMKCPSCLLGRLNHENKLLKDAVHHRDMLLEVIDLKKLIQPGAES